MIVWRYMLYVYKCTVYAYNLLFAPLFALSWPFIWSNSVEATVGDATLLACMSVSEWGEYVRHQFLAILEYYTITVLHYLCIKTAASLQR
jgi:hypothetical protein